MPEQQEQRPLPWEIRKLGPEGQQVMERFLWESIWAPPGEQRPGPDFIKRPDVYAYVESWGTRPGDSAVAAVADGFVLGVAWHRLMLPPFQGHAFFDEATPQVGIAVLSEHRQQGVGSSLLRALLQQASTNHHHLSLSVHPDNPARRLYERFGFRSFENHPSGHISMVVELSATAPQK